MAYEWTNHYAKLFCDFLIAADAASGIPNVQALPRTHQMQTGKLTRPSLHVACEAKESNHRSIFAGDVLVTLRIAVKKEGEQPEEAAVQMEAIQRWLANDEKWAAFIATLPLERRTGWSITHKRIELNIESEDDEEKHTRDITQRIQIRAIAKR